MHIDDRGVQRHSQQHVSSVPRTVCRRRKNLILRQRVLILHEIYVNHTNCDVLWTNLKKQLYVPHCVKLLMSWTVDIFLFGIVEILSFGSIYKDRGRKLMK